MHTPLGIHMLFMITTIICMLTCTHVHIVVEKATLLDFVMIVFYNENLATNYVWVEKTLTPVDPLENGYQKPPLCLLM